MESIVFYGVKKEYEDCIIKIRRIKIENIGSLESGEVLLNSLVDFYDYKSLGSGKSILEIEVNDERREGRYYSVDRLNKLIEEDINNSKSKKFIDFSRTFSVLREVEWYSRDDKNIFVLCYENMEERGYNINNWRGSKYYLNEDKIVRSDSGIKIFCNDLVYKLKGYCMREGIEIIGSGGSRVDNRIDFLKKVIKIVKVLNGEEFLNKVINELKEKKYGYDSKGVVRKGIVEIVENIKENNKYFFVKSLVV